MIRRIFCLTPFILVWQACSLNILTEDKIAGDDAIDNILTAREAIHSAYSDYPHANIDFSVLSEDFFPTYLISRQSNLNLLYKWDAKQITLLSEQLWAGYYKTINDINLLLESEKYIKQHSSKEVKEWRQIKGEAYALKAMAYYDLLNIYSGRYNEQADGIILKDHVMLEYLSRASMGKCVEEINKLLTLAEELLVENAVTAQNYNHRNNYYMNYYAVLLMKARIALYTGNYPDAKHYSQEILDATGYNNESPKSTDFQALWTSPHSVEGVFSFNYPGNLFRNYNESKDLGDYMALPTLFDYEKDDIRNAVASYIFEMKANGASSLMERRLLGKYRESVDVYADRDINVLRLSEAYFILSECLAYTNETLLAVQTLNHFLEKRNATLVDETIDNTSFKERLFFEKQKEYLGEGVSFFDFKRLGKNIRRYKTDQEVFQGIIYASDYRMLFPIPLSELKNNKKATQNDKWPDAVY